MHRDAQRRADHPAAAAAAAAGSPKAGSAVGRPAKAGAIFGWPGEAGAGAMHMPPATTPHAGAGAVAQGAGTGGNLDLAPVQPFLQGGVDIGGQTEILVVQAAGCGPQPTRNCDDSWLLRVSWRWSGGSCSARVTRPATRSAALRPPMVSSASWRWAANSTTAAAAEIIRAATSTRAVRPTTLSGSTLSPLARKELMTVPLRG
ncbi:hypothetical protein amb3345 [Paramagnetospirillum magneticum AMB-1]|uniref:Uncharacterized protein n=1 Tax=Paramagnetospirillum magneticum (strain ATCC 700264 / AMB-1) TaxID=342108 RepID=Q2W1X6_PARM1|nr:hypothetical protein amb3345 [Paramagnetospirillum magneticum AMB-1]